MNGFNQQLISWQPFYSVVATVSATLVGLLFLSLSINKIRITSGDDHPSLRLALRCFGDLLFVLMISLVILVPFQRSYGLGVAMGTLGVQRALSLVNQALKSTGMHPRRANFDQLLRDYALPLLSSVGLLVVGIAIFKGQDEALYILVPVIAALLGTASWNAWILLIHEDEEAESL
jgi:hypothetical protein